MFRVVCAVIVLLAILASGCAMTRSYPQFEDSNQVFLEETIAGLDLVRTLKHAVPGGSRVCLASMEVTTTGDFPVMAMIEDGIIAALRDNGYVVLERDDDMLRRLAAEGGDVGYRFLYLPSDQSTVSVESRLSGVTTGLGVAFGGYGSRELERVRGGDRDEALVFDTDLGVAEYILSYRVLECGIVYRPGLSTRMKKREGLTRLHVRITEVDSGEVLFAGNVQSVLEDEVPSKDAEELSDFHYSFFAPALPVVQSVPKGKRELTSTSKAREETVGKTLLAIGGLVLGVLLISSAVGGAE
jgi:hypothetical protein